MTIRTVFFLCPTALALGACSIADKELVGYQDPGFGNANRSTYAAMIVNPSPEYDTAIPETSAERAVASIDAYREGEVEQPERITTTESISGGGPN